MLLIFTAQIFYDKHVGSCHNSFYTSELTHLEAWLQERILASKDSYLQRRSEDRTYPPDNNNKRQDDGNQRKWTGTVANKPKKQKVNACCLCKEEHRIHKCPKFVGRIRTIRNCQEDETVLQLLDKGSLHIAM